MAFHIILDNPGGELDRWPVAKEDQLQAKLVEIVEALGSINPGDVFRVVED